MLSLKTFFQDGEEDFVAESAISEVLWVELYVSPPHLFGKGRWLVCGTEGLGFECFNYF